MDKFKTQSKAVADSANVPEPSVARPLLLKPMTGKAKRDAIMDAVSALQLTKWPEWSRLKRLSGNTVLDEIQALPEGIFETVDGGFSVVATVYVNLSDGGSRDTVSVTEEFPAHVRGHFSQDGTAVIIEDVSVNTSSFDA